MTLARPASCEATGCVWSRVGLAWGNEVEAWDIKKSAIKTSLIFMSIRQFLLIWNIESSITQNISVRMQLASHRAILAAAFMTLNSLVRSVMFNCEFRSCVRHSVRDPDLNRQRLRKGRDPGRAKTGTEAEWAKKGGGKGSSALTVEVRPTTNAEC